MKKKVVITDRLVMLLSIAVIISYFLHPLPQNKEGNKKVLCIYGVFNFFPLPAYLVWMGTLHQWSSLSSFVRSMDFCWQLMM